MGGFFVFGGRLAKVLALVGELGGNLDGCLMWRVLQPTTELNRQGDLSVGWDFFDNMEVANIVHLFDAVVLPRRHWEPDRFDHGEAWVRALHKANVAVIYEVDDDMFSDDFVNRLVVTHGRSRKQAEAVRESTLFTLRLCDGVTVSSQRLATIVRQFTDKPVRVVPNYIDLEWFRAVQALSKRAVKGLTIGWAGGARPDSDVQEMATAWGRIAEEFPDVTFVVQGHHAPAIYEAVPRDRIAALAWMPVQEYPAGLVNIDIGCCPLADTPFNRAKTYIKALEYAAGGAAVVASPTVYGQIVDHGVDGFICRTADEWTDALRYLVGSANRRKRVAQAMTRKVERYHDLRGNAWRWSVAWADIVADFKRRRTQILVPTSANWARGAIA